MAPMPLVTYEDVRPWAKAIRERVLARQMPPWHIDKTVGIQKFKNDRSLSDAQIPRGLIFLLTIKVGRALPQIGRRWKKLSNDPLRPRFRGSPA